MRAVARAAFLKPFRALSRIAQALRGENRLTCVIEDVAAETSNRSSWCQSQERADIARPAEAACIVNSRNEVERDEWTYAGQRH